MLFFYSDNFKTYIYSMDSPNRPAFCNMLKTANANNARAGSTIRYYEVPMSCMKKMFPGTVFAYGQSFRNPRISSYTWNYT